MTCAISDVLTLALRTYVALSIGAVIGFAVAALCAAAARDDAQARRDARRHRRATMGVKG